MSNSANGKTLPGSRVVAADAIGKLSGVSGKDVARVILAVHAIRVACPHVKLDDLLDNSAVPTEPADKVRFAETEDFVAHVIHQLQKQPTRAIASALRLHRRFVGIRRVA